jgi:spore germination protein KC
LGRLLVELSGKSRQAPLLNYIIAEKDKYHWAGIAVFKRDKMIGLLENLDEISVLLQTRFGYKGRTIMAACGEDPAHMVSFMPASFGKEIKVTEKPQIQVNINVKGKIYEKNCSFNLRDERNLALLEKKIAATYKAAAERLIRRAQREWKWDIFHFGDYVRAYHPMIWNRGDWWQSFPKIPIKIDYQVEINRIGMQSH